MTITATEFKQNFGKYMELVKTEDIIVTKNGKPIGIFSNPETDPFETFIHILDGCDITEDIDNVREERINERYKEYF